MIKVIQENCRASEDIMTALMSAAVRAGAEVVLIQEPSVKKEEDGWKPKIRDANFIYIFSGDSDRPYVLTAIRKDIKWTDYGGSRSPERVGIDVGGTRIINIYHHREQKLDSTNIMEEIHRNGQKKWVCAGDFNSHNSLWDGYGREPGGSWREVKEIVECGRLMIEPGTPTWKGGKNHRSSTIDLVIASHSAQVSMVEIASDLYTGSDHETLCWEIDDGGWESWETHKISSPGWKIRKPFKDDERDEEEEWRQEWKSRLYPNGHSTPRTPLDQISLFKGFLDDIFGQKRWSPRAKRWWTKELEEERDILGEARRTTPPSSDRFKQARNRWLRAIRKAKRECWEQFLQASDPGLVWKSINAKPQMCAMPQILSSPSGEQYHTLEEKMEAIANISFPSKPGETDSTLEDTQPTTELGSNTNANERTYFRVCPKLLKRLLRRTRNTSAPGLDGIGWQELKIWFLLDPTGLCNLINEQVRTGLPPELKIARGIVIPKPGRRDRTIKDASENLKLRLMERWRPSRILWTSLMQIRSQVI
jgi:hypothetical protein